MSAENQVIGIEAFVRTATKEQRELLFEISDLHEKEIKLTNQIKQNYDAIKTGGLFDGVAITPIEDEDDAMVVSIGPRNELKEVKESMKRSMIKAVEMGMGNVGLIRRNYESYVGKPIEG